jgi:ABC-2 type transport system permease protein
VLDGTDALLRLLLWALLMTAYLGLLAAGGVAVALRAPNARIALALLFGLWIALALAAPRGASSAADNLRPLPSSQAVKQRMLDEAPAYWSAEDAAHQKAALLARYGVSRIEDIPNPRMAELDMVERRSHQIFDRVLGPFYAQVTSQDRLFASFGMFSPTVSAGALSASIAGSDFSHHHDFIVAAEHYRRNLVNRMNGDGMAHAAQGSARHVNDIGLWSQVPEFAYRPPALGSANATALPALVTLLLWLAVAWGSLALSARRLRP